MPVNTVSQTSYSQPIQRQQTPPTVSNYIEKPSEDKNNKKALIAVGAALALVTLGVLGHQGYLGKGVQKALGGAKKAGEEAAKSKKKVSETVEEKTARTANPAIKEELQPQIMPNTKFKGEISQTLDKELIPEKIDIEPEFLNDLKKQGEISVSKKDKANVVYKYYSADKIVRYETIETKGCTRTTEFDVMGNIKSISINKPSEDGNRIIQRNHYDASGNLQEIETLNYNDAECNLRAFYDKEGNLNRYSAIAKDGNSYTYNVDGTVNTSHGATGLRDLP